MNGALRFNIAWGAMLLGALLLVFVSAPYLALDPEVYFERQRDVYEAHTFWITLHIAAMIVAALLGPFQFRSGLRARYPRLHRVSGRVYLAAAAIGSIGGLYMARYSASGAISGVGFAMLGAGVLITGAIAFARIRARDSASHREWMIRNYALIFAAVTLRLYLLPLEAAFGERNGYAIVAWACWIPNLIVAEWIIARSRPRLDAPSADWGVA